MIKPSKKFFFMIYLHKEVYIYVIPKFHIEINLPSFSPKLGENFKDLS